jgi:hypothetical protein
VVSLCYHDIIYNFPIENGKTVRPDFVSYITLTVNHSKSIHPRLDKCVFTPKLMRGAGFIQNLEKEIWFADYGLMSKAKYVNFCVVIP